MKTSAVRISVSHDFSGFKFDFENEKGADAPHPVAREKSFPTGKRCETIRVRIKVRIEWLTLQ